MSTNSLTNKNTGRLDLLVQAAEHFRAEDEKDNANGKRTKIIQSKNPSMSGPGSLRWNAGVKELEKIISLDATKSPRITGKPKLDETNSANSVFQQAFISIKHLESVKESKLSEIEKTRIRNDEAAVEIAKIEKEIIFASPNNPKIHQHLKFIKNCAKVTASGIIESEKDFREKRKRCDSDIYGDRPTGFMLRPGKKRPRWIESRPLLNIPSLDPVTINETNRRREGFNNMPCKCRGSRGRNCDCVLANTSIATRVIPSTRDTNSEPLKASGV